MDGPEFWLRGPLPGIPALLQPVGHALLQARQEVNTMMEGFPDDRLWDRPAGLASPGFHLQHLAGVLDRLFTYANGEMLSREQMAALGAEKGPQTGDASVREGLVRFNQQIDNALHQLRQVAEPDLTETRLVGRDRLPSTVIGLLFHAAEHTMRHTGQLLVTSRILRGVPEGGNRRE